MSLFWSQNLMCWYLKLKHENLRFLSITFEYSGDSDLATWSSSVGCVFGAVTTSLCFWSSDGSANSIVYWSTDLFLLSFLCRDLWGGTEKQNGNKWIIQESVSARRERCRWMDGGWLKGVWGVWFKGSCPSSCALHTHLTLLSLSLLFLSRPQTQTDTPIAKPHATAEGISAKKRRLFSLRLVLSQPVSGCGGPAYLDNTCPVSP